MSFLAPLKRDEIPDAPAFRKLIGPSFILLGLGLGSGELILWPYLSSNYGLGIIWGAVIGISLQFFINMEISRYTLATGESVFVGLTRKMGKVAPVWFILSTLVPWMWPGIIASSATVLGNLLGITNIRYLGIILLLFIGILLSLGTVVYKTQEKLQKLIILIGVPFIFILTFYIAKGFHWQKLLSGIFGIGENYLFLPKGLPFATFLAALAYAGAGGNLNLAQSIYIKEKGYAMGKYSGRITNIIRGKKENITLEGTSFEPTQENKKTFADWWKKVNLEHLIVFWGTGCLTMLMLSLLAFSTVYKSGDLTQGIGFVLKEAVFIGGKTLPFLGTLFLLSVTLMLFGTQFSVFGSTSRIMSENLVILNKEKFKINNLSKYFYFFLWLQIIAGIIIFSVGFTEPLTLVIIGAVLNAFTMFIYSGLILWLNLANLDKSLRPSIFRIIMVFMAFIFYGSFSIFTVIQYLRN